MSKKIDAASKALIHALERHATIAGKKPVPQKKAGRAAGELRAAATAYAEAVEARTGQSNPFIDVLDSATIDSLIAERDRVARDTSKKTAKKPVKASPADILTPPIPAGAGTDDLHAQTLISLRTLAKSRGLANISRLSKAALVERLEQGESHS